jgi:hypothetical protein
VHLDFFFTVEGTSQQRPHKRCTLIFFFKTVEGTSQQRPHLGCTLIFVFSTVEGTSQQRPHKGCTLIFVFLTVEGTSQQRPNKGCTLIFFFFFLTVEGEGGGGMEFFLGSLQKEAHNGTQSFLSTTMSIMNRGKFSRCFILTSSTRIIERSNDMPNKRHG